MTKQNLLTAWEPLTQHAVFRRLMHAFSYPGRVETLCDDEGGHDAALTQLLAVLLDADVSLADPDCLLEPGVLALCEARMRTPEQAQFVVARADLAPRFAPATGSLESPEQGATLILRVARIGEGATLQVSGPGVDGSAALRVDGLDPGWLAARSEWNALFPLGVDIILVDGRRVVALPRTSVVAGGPGKGEY